MRLSKLRALGNRGDTIVEVLIVIIVITAVLGGAYAVATRSQKTNQQTQEHTQALKLAEAQIENLKAYNGSPITVNKFCFRENGSPQTTGFSSGSVTDGVDADNFSRYPSQCRRTPEDAPDCTSYCYYLGITKGPAGDPDRYTVTVRWDGINGRQEEVKLYYRYRMPS